MKSTIIKIILLLSIYSIIINCSKEPVQDITSDEQLLEDQFMESMPEMYYNVLIYLLNKKGYSFSDVEEVGHIISQCDFDQICLSNQFSNGQQLDFLEGLRFVTLPSVNIQQSNSGIWNVTFDEINYSLSIQHQLHDFDLDFDLDNTIDDDRAIGLIPTANMTIYHVLADDRQFNFIKPTEDGGTVESIDLSLIGDTVFFKTRGGKYSNLKNSNDTSKVFMNLKVYVSDIGQPTFSIEGLYYIFMHEDGSTIKFESDEGLQEHTISAGDDFTIYRENVRFLEGIDPLFGRFRLKSDVRRLQFDTRGADGTFELDFDHSYKDRGQKSVNTLLQI